MHLRMSRARFRSLIALAVVLSAAAIAAVDLATGDEIRIFPLYFLPLTLVAWHFGRTAAIVGSLLMTLVWTAAMYLGGRTYSMPSIWAVNFLAQAATFLTISLLVAKLQEGMRRERALGRVDPLTGLPNRRAFYEEADGVLASCSRHNRPATLAYLDLDNFKSANDQFGHQHGDAVLREVAEVLARSLRASDVTGRIGGDEFVVLLPETTTETARTALEKVRASLNRRPLLAAAGVTVSIGAITYEPAPDDLAEMMRAADDVMYRVKGSSKDRVRMEARCMA
jgi:diguanylate cyclase (GGDEF)-like protein